MVCVTLTSQISECRRRRYFTKSISCEHRSVHWYSIGWTCFYVLTAPLFNLQFALDQALDSTDLEEQHPKVTRWQRGKKGEYKAIVIAGALVASVVTASLQWSGIDGSFWLVRGAWIGSLTLSLFCVIIAFHLGIFLSTAEVKLDGAIKLMEALRGDSIASRRTNVFILQAPILLFSYSIISYLVGLSLLIISPLWASPSVDDKKIAAVFIAYFCFGLVFFLGACIMIYGKLISRLR